MNANAKRITSRRSRRRAASDALVLAFLLPAFAAAQEEFTLEEPTKPPLDPEKIAELTEIRSTIEIGIGYVDESSFRFGRYTGLEDDGVYGVLNMDWLKRGPYDGEDASYSRATINDTGLGSREATIEFGRQGDFRLRVDYDQMVLFRSDTSQTIFEGAGGTQLTLPASWVGAQNTAGLTQLLPSLNGVDIDHERQRIGLGFDKVLQKNWSFSTHYRHEDKEGLKTLGAVIGNSGGNPRSALLPEPINYSTQDFDVALRYTAARFQAEGRFYISLFNDENEAVTWQNPYAAINGWDASAGFPTGSGQISLPPDNKFYQLSLMVGYDFTERTRMTADIALGRMTQDERFLPYTINPVLAASITQPLPRESLDGEIDTTVVNLRVASRPSDRFTWNASFRYDDRDNDTPRDEYVYIGGDSQLQNTAVTSSFQRFNEPYSYREAKLRLDAAYRLGDATRLSASAERRDFERTFTERDDTEDDTFTLVLSQDVSEWFSGSLRAARSDRSGSTYIGNEPFLSGFDPGFTSTVPGEFENPPALRKYYLASRERDQYGLLATLTPSEHWTIGLDAEYADDDYDSSELGLTDSRTESYTVDLSYTPPANWSAYLFYTYENLRYEQNGVSIRGATRVTDVEDPARSWNARHRDRVDTAGAGFKWRAIEDRLEIGADYVYADSDGTVAVTTGSALTSAPLPPTRTRLHSVSVYGNYRVNRDLSVRLRWWNEKFRFTNFALDGIEANQLANVIALGETTPDYHLDVAELTLIYRF